MAYLEGFGPEGDHLRDRFDTQWGSTTEVAWGNVTYTPPDDEAWVRFRVRHEWSERADIGPNPRHRYDGTVVIEVFVPFGQGEGTLDDLCDTAAAIFRDYTDQQGLRFFTERIVEVGATDGWYKKDVLIPFQRDTIYS